MIYYELCEELTGQHFVQNIFKLKAKSVGNYRFQKSQISEKNLIRLREVSSRQ